MLATRTLLAILALATLGAAQLSFAPVVQHAVSAQPGGILAVDMDLDGDVDLVTSGADVSVLLNNGNGTFAAAQSWSAGEATGWLATGDFDGDLFPDIVAMGTQTGSVLVMTNDANGGLGAPTSLVSGIFVNQPVHATDYDMDGNVDVLVGPQGTALGMIQNTGGGSFAAPAWAFIVPTPGTTLFGARLVDFDGDGDDDLAAGTIPFPYPAGVVIFENQNGTYVQRGGVYTGGTPTAIADFDADGAPDVVTPGWSLREVGVNTWSPSWIFGTPPSTAYFPGVSSGAGVAADFDGDGDQDVASLNSYGLISFFRDDGNLNLSAPLDFIVGDSPGSVVTADLDADGRPDLATCSAATASVAVRLNTSVATTPGANGLNIVSGNGQSAPQGTPFANPLVVQLTDPTGAPIAGAPVTFESAQSGFATATVAQVSTDATGHASWVATAVTPFNTTVPAQQTVVASADATTPVEFSLNTPANVPLSAHIIAGDLQTAPITADYPVPLVVQVVDANGLPVAGVTVSFYSAYVVFPSGATTTTDANGLAFASAQAGPSPGTLLVTAQVSGNSVANPLFQLTGTHDANMSSAAGSGQSTWSGRPTPFPLAAQVVDLSGNPIAGRAVTFTYDDATATPHAAITDASGVALGLPAAGELTGARTVIATAPGAQPVAFTVFVRGLDAVWDPGPGDLAVTLESDISPMPFLLAADVPQPAPIHTPFGAIHTSILNPQPTLLVLDGLGLLAPADPTAVGTPTWTRTFNLGATVPPGTSLVFQLHGYDPSAPWPANWHVSNVVSVVF